MAGNISIQRVLLRTPGRDWEGTYAWKVDEDHPPLEVGDAVETDPTPNEFVKPRVVRVVKSTVSEWPGTCKFVYRKVPVELELEATDARLLRDLLGAVLNVDATKQKFPADMRLQLISIHAQLLSHPAIDSD